MLSYTQQYFPIFYHIWTYNTSSQCSFSKQYAQYSMQAWPDFSLNKWTIRYLQKRYDSKACPATHYMTPARNVTIALCTLATSLNPQKCWSGLANIGEYWNLISNVRKCQTLYDFSRKLLHTRGNAHDQIQHLNPHILQGSNWSNPPIQTIHQNLQVIMTRIKLVGRSKLLVLPNDLI